MSILNEISENLQRGRAKAVKELVAQAVEQGMSPEVILEQGLLSGMDVIGEKFKKNEVFVPEVLVAARAMNMGVSILKPLLADGNATAKGKACIGTVKGDLHDIGKNLVKMMLEGKGIEVVDLGTDVAPETFVQTAIDENCQLIRGGLPGRFIQQGLVDEGFHRSDITQRILIPLLTTAFQGRKRLCGGLHHGDADRR